MSSAEECLKRIQGHRGVRSIYILNDEGKIIKSSADDEDSKNMCATLHQLVLHTRGTVRDINVEDRLKFMRVRTDKVEIMIAPEQVEGKFTLVVIQDPSECQDKK